VQVQRVGERYLVQAQALLEVPPVLAWDTLTDYERLPQFVPDLHRVQVVERNGSQLTVDYDGQVRHAMREQFEALVAEIERRHAAPR